MNHPLTSLSQEIFSSVVWVAISFIIFTIWPLVRSFIIMLLKCSCLNKIIYLLLVSESAESFSIPVLFELCMASNTVKQGIILLYQFLWHIYFLVFFFLWILIFTHILNVCSFGFCLWPFSLSPCTFVCSSYYTVTLLDSLFHWSISSLRSRTASCLHCIPGGLTQRLASCIPCEFLQLLWRCSVRGDARGWRKAELMLVDGQDV